MKIKADDEIVRTSCGLLSEWWCVPVGAEPDEVIDAILKEVILPINGDRSLVVDRLFGGFRCENEERRHACLLTGSYCYADDVTNTPLSAAERQERWGKLLEKSTGENGFVGGGPFCEDNHGTTA
jgi:hypothetical protein